MYDSLHHHPIPILILVSKVGLGGVKWHAIGWVAVGSRSRLTWCSIYVAEVEVVITQFEMDWATPPLHPTVLRESTSKVLFVALGNKYLTTFVSFLCFFLFPSFHFHFHFHCLALALSPSSSSTSFRPHTANLISWISALPTKFHHGWTTWMEKLRDASASRWVWNPPIYSILEFD